MRTSHTNSFRRKTTCATTRGVCRIPRTKATNTISPVLKVFCRDAALSLGAPATSDTTRVLRSLENLPIDNENDTHKLGSRRGFAYKKRDHYDRDPEWINRRLSGRLKHDHILIEGESTQLYCVLCCQLKHDQENAGHTRKGFKTRYQCSDCGVALCRTERWVGQLSCYTRFHTDQELSKPCEAPEQLLPSTRQNSRVRTAPNRQRNSLNTSKQRAPSVRLQSKKRRRSLSLQEQE